MFDSGKECQDLSLHTQLSTINSRACTHTHTCEHTHMRTAFICSKKGSDLSEGAVVDGLLAKRSIQKQDISLKKRRMKVEEIDYLKIKYRS